MNLHTPFYSRLLVMALVATVLIFVGCGGQTSLIWATNSPGSPNQLRRTIFPPRFIAANASAYAAFVKRNRQSSMDAIATGRSSGEPHVQFGVISALAASLASRLVLTETTITQANPPAKRRIKIAGDSVFINDPARINTAANGRNPSSIALPKAERGLARCALHLLHSGICIDLV